MSSKTDGRISANAWKLASKSKNNEISISEILKVIDSSKSALIQPSRSKIESVYDGCSDLKTLSNLQAHLRDEFSKVSSQVYQTEHAISIIENKLIRQQNLKSNVPIFKKLSTELREARTKRSLLYAHMSIVSERCAISRQTLDADRRIQDDIFALIENKRREFVTEVDASKSGTNIRLYYQSIIYII